MCVISIANSLSQQFALYTRINSINHASCLTLCETASTYQYIVGIYHTEGGGIKAKYTTKYMCWRLKHYQPGGCSVTHHWLRSWPWNDNSQHLSHQPFLPWYTCILQMHGMSLNFQYINMTTYIHKFRGILGLLL